GPAAGANQVSREQSARDPDDVASEGRSLQGPSTAQTGTTENRKLGPSLALMSGVPAVRRLSQRVATSPGCRPLLRMYEAASATQPSRWIDIESQFLRAMWEFDEE